MALVEATIQQEILSNMQARFDETDDPQAAQEAFAADLAATIVAAIKSATITFPSGTIVVAGSPTTQSNLAPVTGAIIT